MFPGFRINPSEEEALSYSFHDQLLMRGLGEMEGEDHQFVFILASRAEGEMKGLKYRMTGRMITSEAPEGVDVEIRTPCMEKIRYRMATSRNGSSINSLMEKVQSEGIKEALVSMERSISPKFLQKANSLSKNISILEQASRDKSKKIQEAKRKLDEKFENSFELKKIRGINSDLETAMGLIMKDVNMNIQDDLEEEEVATLEEDLLNNSMTTNVDNEALDILPSSQDTS